MKMTVYLAFCACFCMLPFLAADDSVKLDTASEKTTETPVESEGDEYLLRYHFRKGDVLKWDVVQQIDMKTQIATQQNTTQTYSRSTKVWTVIDVDDKGTATFEYSVEDAEMNNKAVTKTSTPVNDEPAIQEEEAYFNSKEQDEEPNPRFLELISSLKIPLAHMTINSRGELLKKVQKAPYAAAAEENRIAIPMPEKPVKVGDSWDAPNDIIIPENNGTVRKIAAKQRFTLEKIQNGIATIRFKTIRLAPVVSAKDKMKMIDKEPSGIIYFDIKAGCNIEQQSDMNQNILNWTEGTASSASYQSRFTEKYLK